MKKVFKRLGNEAFYTARFNTFSTYKTSVDSKNWQKKTSKMIILTFFPEDPELGSQLPVA